MCSRTLASQGCRTALHWSRSSSSAAALPPVQAWSHPPSNAQIPDDEINRLAASPRRPLTLADLVKLVSKRSPVNTTNKDSPDMGDHRSLKKPCYPRRTLRCLYFLRGSPIESKVFVISPSSLSPIRIFQRSTTITFTPSPPFCPSRKDASPRSRRRSILPK